MQTEYRYTYQIPIFQPKITLVVGGGGGLQNTNKEHPHQKTVSVCKQNIATIHPSAVPDPTAVRQRFDVTIGNHRYADILLDESNGFEVHWLVPLFWRATMYSDPGCASLLCSLTQFYRLSDIHNKHSRALFSQNSTLCYSYFEVKSPQNSPLAPVSHQLHLYTNDNLSLTSDVSTQIWLQLVQSFRRSRI